MKRKLILGLLILVVVVAGFASAHLYASGKVEEHMNIVHQGIGIAHIAIIPKANQIGIILSVKNPTDIPVYVELSNLFVSFDGVARSTYPDNAGFTVNPQQEFRLEQLIASLPKNWKPESPEVDLTVTGDAALSATYLWMDGSVESPLNLTHKIYIEPGVFQPSEEESLEIAREFVRSSPTFRFDGIEETLEHVETLYPDIPYTWEFVFNFKCRNAGYGDRAGQMLPPVITPHTAHIVVQEGRVISALMDEQWDMIRQEMVSSEIREFLVEDPDGDRMAIQVSPIRQEAIEALTEMSKTGETKWVGGEIERFENEFGFRFRPDTIVVAEVTAEGLQASKCKYIQEDFEYWEGLGTIYISGKVVEVLK